MPMYALGRAAVIYSDDQGKTWNRIEGRYSKNIDESQLMELSDGRIVCLGRQLKYGRTPMSVSCDGGQHFSRYRACGLYSVRCQKSILKLPRDSENGFHYSKDMDPNKEYFVSVHPSGHRGKDSSRTDGVLSLCEIEGTKVTTVREWELKEKSEYSYLGKTHDFFAYSSIALLPDGSIGIFYEAHPSGLLIIQTLHL